MNRKLYILSFDIIGQDFELVLKNHRPNFVEKNWQPCPAIVVAEEKQVSDF